jgi:hypothetical protein
LKIWNSKQKPTETGQARTTPIRSVLEIRLKFIKPERDFPKGSSYGSGKGRE